MPSHILREIEVFASLDDEALRGLYAMAEERSVEEDDLVFAVGDPADAFYVILDGRVSLFRDVVGRPVRLLGRLEAGEWFGEMALFGEERRELAVRAMEQTRLLLFPRPSLESFLEAHPRVRFDLQISAARRKSLNVATSLEPDRHEDARIALRTPVLLETVHGEMEVELLNLSLGGMSLSGAPAYWGTGDEVAVALVIGDRKLRRRAKVVWRTSHGLGLSFVDPPDGHEHEIYHLVHELGDR